MIEGNGPAPLLVLSLVRGLPDTSMTHALASGGLEHLGWGVERWLAAETFNAIQENTRATGNWKKEPPKFPRWPTPRDKKTKPKSVADIYSKFRR